MESPNIACKYAEQSDDKVLSANQESNDLYPLIHLLNPRMPIIFLLY